MPFLDIEKNIDFNDTILNCQITGINKQKIDIANVEIKFQKNRTIIFTIYSNESILQNDIKEIEGKYFNYKFYSTISESGDNDFSILNNEYIFIINLIEFTKGTEFFINSKLEHNIKLLPSKNFSEYIKKELERKNNLERKRLSDLLSIHNINKIDFSKNLDFIRSKNINSLPFYSYIINEYIVDIKILNKDDKLANLFDFKNIHYEEYNSKIKYIMELYTLIFNVPILIEKVIINKNTLYQSQNLNIKLMKSITNENTFFLNNYFTVNLYKYLELFISFIKNKSIVNKLLKHYFIDEIYDGKNIYNLNDISGFIDLFDGIFFKLEGQPKEKKILLCNECSKKYETNKKVKKSLNEKIDYVINKLEPELKKYKIDIGKDSSTVLANFRNSIRHPKEEYTEFKLDKIIGFARGILKLYIIKHILKIDNSDYDIYKILSDFKVYPLVKHIYRFFDKRVIIYNTQKKASFPNKILTENTIYFLTIQEQKEFKNAKPKDFIYDEDNSIELKKIYIDEKDKLRNNLIHGEVIIFNNQIISKFNGTYENFKLNLELK